MDANKIFIHGRNDQTSGLIHVLNFKQNWIDIRPLTYHMQRVTRVDRKLSSTRVDVGLSTTRVDVRLIHARVILSRPLEPIQGDPIDALPSKSSGLLAFNHQTVVESSLIVNGEKASTGS